MSGLGYRTPPKGETWRIDWKEWGVLSTSAAQRKALFARDGGVCRHCGKHYGNHEWEAEHAFPLHAVRGEYPAILRFWSLENLETRCRACHRIKSASEAKARAKIVRIRKRLDGTRRPRRKVPSRPLRKPNKDFKPTPTKQIRENE